MQGMFQEHLAECRSLAAQAQEELKRVRTVSQTEREGLCTAAFSLLKQADDNLQSLQMEARSAPSDERAQLAREEQQLRADLRVAAKELEQVRRELLLGDRGGGNTDRLFLAREERRRTTAVTDSLSRGRDHLKAANKQALETEKIGVDTLQELRKQREVICRMKDNAHDLGSNLSDAQKSVKELEQPQCTLM